MVQINWTNRAKKDLKQIHDFISNDSFTYANNQVNRILYRVEVLIHLPLVGKTVQEINDKTIREIIEGNYRIIYRIMSPNRIDILTIHHGARSFKKRKIK